MAKGRLEQYLTDLSRGLERARLTANQDLRLKQRPRRSYSMRQCARFLDVSYQYLTKFAAQTPAFPEGAHQGRERVFTAHELMTIRILMAASAKRPGDYLAWRAPLDPLPVISFASQKGGTAKSLSAAHFAQYLSLNYGMRVGLMDADPQHTLTLYFAGEESGGLPEADTPTLVDFAGLYPDGDSAYTENNGRTLDSFFAPTGYPGMRIVPAHSETSEGEIQIARLLRANPPGKRFYRYLRDAIDVWSAANPPRTAPGDIDLEHVQDALTETLDVIVIDYQPALTLFQLNNVIASTSLVIPQTMKGFDIATLATFANGLLGMLQHILDHDRIEIGSGEHMLLPTIVQRSNEQDLIQLQALMENCPGEILPVFYTRSDAIANAADVYQSAYEYEPDTRGKKKGIDRFIDNADAVNDAIVARLWPGRERGHADAWMAQMYAEDTAAKDKGEGA